MDRYEEMRTFVEVSRHGVNGASRRMRIAPSAVSRRVKDLEARLGATLLTRTGRRMMLTDAGDAYLDSAKRILGEVDEAEAKVRDAQGELSGQIRVAAPLSFGLSYVAPALNEFLTLHPGVTLGLDLNDRRVDVLREGFDLAIRVGTLADSALVARRIGGCPFVVAASPGWAEENGEPSRPDDLKGVQGLCYAAKPHPETWAWKGERGSQGEVRVEARVTASNGDALRDAAIAGLGVLCEPRFILADALRDGRLVRLLEAYDWGEVGAYALWPPRDYVPALLRAVIDHLAAALKAT